jgi:ESCRT-II complex subunit VPS22
LRKQLETFRSHLEAFARKHRDAIRKDPKFRAHFQTMCDRLGVDPLACRYPIIYDIHLVTYHGYWIANKGFWADIFGVGDFYYELAVQAIEASMKSREADGGLVALDELKRRVIERRGANGANISENDLLKAIRSLKPLGSGMDVIEIGGRCMIRTVPRELSHDETTVLAIAQEHHAQVTVDLLLGKLNWTLDRVETCLVR